MLLIIAIQLHSILSITNKMQSKKMWFIFPSSTFSGVEPQWSIKWEYSPKMHM